MDGFNKTAEKVINCIGNGDRLGILAALLEEPSNVASLIKKLGYNTTGQAYHHLKPLLAADLIESHKSRGVYGIQPNKAEGLRKILEGIRELADSSEGEWDSEIHSGALMVDERYMVTPDEERKILETCFVSLKPPVLKVFPPKQKRKLVILRVIAREFEAGRRYSEKEVNAVLKPIFADYATIRRYLLEYGFMDRTLGGKEYWLA